MSDSKTALEIRYQPTRCQLMEREVWAVVARQADGNWRIVNCLDKDFKCYGIECAFTTDCGTWPYEVTPEVSNSAS